MSINRLLKDLKLLQAMKTVSQLMRIPFKAGTADNPPHRHLRNIDCLMARTACLVCFMSTVNSHIKKRSLLRAALVAGTWQNLSSLYYLDVYDPPIQIAKWACLLHRYRRRKIDCSSLFTVPATSAAQNSLLFFFFLLRLLTELISKQGRP